MRTFPRRSRSLWRGVLLALTVLVPLSPSRASAQSTAAPGPCDSGNGAFASCRLHITIPTTIQPTRLLTVQGGTSFSLTPAGGGLSAADLSTGFFDAPGSLGFSVSANAPWEVTVRVATPFMTGSCSAKAANTIQWGGTSGTRSTPLATSAATVVTGSAGTVNLARSLYFRVGVAWLTDGPVTEPNCGLPLVLSVEAP